eukprot:CAMPEP_0176448744 /NCGR_PEP_ID=MMETSP0127-20121128/26002_1 /TAXON_ID=938130 /ORGANISM="Platyophrya macrostoma, Strain WH" /LENGTH=364 /DNA_ID=CAMNT_0017835825 /DNA_START=251 /DNA_END=1345 /DNA_ORIENTATION=+
MPRPYTPYGMKNHYEKKEKTFGLKKTEHPELKKLGVLKSEYGRIKMEEEENLIMRNVKAMNEVQKQIKLKAQTDEDKLVSENISSNIKERSKEFYELQKHLDEINADARRLPTTKREVVFRRLNKLAKEGIVSKQELKNNKTLLEDEELVNQKLQSAEFKELVEERKKKFEEWMDLITPTNPQEFKELLRKNTDLTRDKLQKETDDAFAYAGERGIVLTRYDAIQMASKGLKAEEESAREGPSTMDGLIKAIKENPKDVLIPSKQRINPIPDFTVLDPTEDYDLGLGYSELSNPNKYYESYPSPAHQPMKIPKTKFKWKMNKGRKTAIHPKFSTLNSFGARMVTPSVVPYIPMLTGLIRKIGRF